MKVPDLYVGKQLYVGCANPPAICLGVGPSRVRGSAYLEGPVLVGTPLSYTTGPNVAEANLMVARCGNVEALPPPPSIFKVSTRGLAPTQLDVILGDPSGPVGINCYCGPMSFIVQATNINLVTLASYTLTSPTISRAGAMQDVGKKVFAGSKTELGVDHNIAKAFNSAPITGTAPFACPDFVSKTTSLTSTFKIAVSKKGFDIPHPTKEDHRLRYICVEGPSAEVYLRGKLKNQTYIDLPEYWRNLVDAETIGVSLTPIGYYQELFVESIEWGTRIRIKNNIGSSIHCSYIVFAERKDTSKNIPEYKGLTPYDYPGDNEEYVINGKIM